MTSKTNAPTFEFSTKGPIRFENLRPGSMFTIFAEPSRRIRRSNDARVYQRAYDGFYATHPATGAGVVLFPQDLVRPMKKVK